MNAFRLLFGAFVLLPVWAVRPCLADSRDNDDGTTTNYYWQGSQLNNLGRLGNPDPNFEDTQRKARLDKTQDSYLATIRAQISHQAAANADKKALLLGNGQLVTDPVEVVYTPSAIEVTLHAEMLFSDNGTAVKTGTADILERLRGILQKEDVRPVHFVIADRLDEIPNANDVDGERARMILALLQFPEKGSSQENLSTEPLLPQ